MLKSCIQGCLNSLIFMKEKLSLNATCFFYVNLGKSQCKYSSCTDTFLSKKCDPDETEYPLNPIPQLLLPLGKEITYGGLVCVFKPY